MAQLLTHVNVMHYHSIKLTRQKASKKHESEKKEKKKKKEKAV